MLVLIALGAFPMGPTVTQTQLIIRNVLTRRREYGTYLATAHRHRRRIKMQKRDE